MKKVFFTTFMAMLIIAFTGCSKDDDDDSTSYGGHGPKGLIAVDLGLPSGTKWANMNVGASKPEEFGGDYAWGETEVKEEYNWKNYIHCDGSERTCHDLGESICGTEYDVAHVKWGGKWQMPSSAQILELIHYCHYEEAHINDVKGMKFVAPNGNSIFFPTYDNNDNSFPGKDYNNYWTGTPYNNTVYKYSGAEYFHFSYHHDNTHLSIDSRYLNKLVRPVLVLESTDFVLSDTSVIIASGADYTVHIFKGFGSYSAESSYSRVVSTTKVFDQSFVIHAHKAGKAIITVKDEISGQSATIDVTVTCCPDDNHPHTIDLGLPSGTKWACCNVGTNIPEGYGGYYAWGETEEKDIYDEVTYKYCTGEEKQSTGFYRNPKYQDIGDNICGTGYDVAHVKWGGNWQMPSLEQIKELLENCTSEWTIINEIPGMLIASKTVDQCIFLPSAGYRLSEIYDHGEYPYLNTCWSSTRDPDHDGYAYGLHFSYASSGLRSNCSSFQRFFGHSVRPVTK